MAIALSAYLIRRKINASELAEEIGVSRQVISHRIKEGYLVGIIDDTFKIFHPRNMIEVKVPPSDSVDETKTFRRKTFRKKAFRKNN